MGWVTKINSPQTIGVELPGSGSGTRHFMLLVAFQCTGRFFSSQMPVPSGPRQPGQFPALPLKQNSSSAMNNQIVPGHRPFIKHIRNGTQLNAVKAESGCRSNGSVTAIPV